VISLQVGPNFAGGDSQQEFDEFSSKPGAIMLEPVYARMLRMLALEDLRPER
jgi:hypothetical protein